MAKKWRLCLLQKRGDYVYKDNFRTEADANDTRNISVICLHYGPVDVHIHFIGKV